MTRRLEGILLGTAVGDALGLPLEGLGPARIRRRFPGPPRHRLLPGLGMTSDDTEHTLFVAQALLAHPDDVQAFQRALAWKLRFWFLSLPAGIGLATLRACLKLCLGFPARHAGVYSAGNGPAMRSALIGAVFAADPARRRAYVRASTRLTHTDPRAEIGALAIAEAAALAVGPAAPAPEAVLAHLADLSDEPEWQGLLATLREAWTERAPVAGLADRLGLARGVTGYVYHTVPIALYAWLAHAGDYAATIAAVLALGGDTDTVAAIAGALAGATVGSEGIPAAWITGLKDWPRGVPVLRAIAARLEAGSAAGAQSPVRYFWPGVLARNGLFLTIVLAHGFRRLAPPY